MARTKESRDGLLLRSDPLSLAYLSQLINPLSTLPPNLSAFTEADEDATMNESDVKTTLI